MLRGNSSAGVGVAGSDGWLWRSGWEWREGALMSLSWCRGARSKRPRWRRGCEELPRSTVTTTVREGQGLLADAPDPCN